MEKLFSTHWKGSRQPRKQRKYRHNAPLHIRRSFMNARLSKELAKKYGIKRTALRVGDKVRIMRGEFKGKESKVELLNLKKSKVMITGVEFTKKDGSKSRPLVHASNLLILELNTDDKRRLQKNKEK
jgi:large subunit ribosomal protein L24